MQAGSSNSILNPLNFATATLAKGQLVVTTTASNFRGKRRLTHKQSLMAEDWDAFIHRLKGPNGDGVSIIESPALPPVGTDPMLPEYGWVTFPMGRHGDLFDVLQAQNQLIVKLLVEERKRRLYPII